MSIIFLITRRALALVDAQSESEIMLIAILHLRLLRQCYLFFHMIEVNFQNAFVGTQAKRILDIDLQRICSGVFVKQVQSGEEKCFVYERIVSSGKRFVFDVLCMILLPIPVLLSFLN